MLASFDAMNALLPGLSSAVDLHPLFVHFPVAFWCAAAVLLPLGWVARRPGWFASGRLLLWLGTAAALVAAATGYLAARRMGHDAPGHDLVHVHRNLMLTATGVATLASGASLWAREHRGRSAGLVVVLASALGVLTVLGADRGAHLVFGYGMGVTAEPHAGSGGHEDAAGSRGGHDHGDHGH